MFRSFLKVAVAPTLSAALAVIAIGCQLAGSTTSSDGPTDADTVAAAVADPTNETTQEGVDVGSYVFGAGTVDSSTDALYFSGDLANFVWNPATLAYERTRTNFTITLPYRTVQVSSVFVQIRFFTSSDASGTGYGPFTLTSGLDPAVHSLTYYRTISGTTTNTSTGTTSVFSGTSNLTYANINTTAHTVTVSGTHSRSFTRTYANGRVVQGTISDTLNSLVITYNPSTHVFTWTGSLSYVYQANVTRSNGTQVSRQSSATINFSGSSIFVVDIDGVQYDFSVLDGSSTG